MIFKYILAASVSAGNVSTAVPSTDTTQLVNVTGVPLDVSAYGHISDVVRMFASVNVTVVSPMMQDVAAVLTIWMPSCHLDPDALYCNNLPPTTVGLSVTSERSRILEGIFAHVDHVDPLYLL